MARRDPILFYLKGVGVCGGVGIANAAIAVKLKEHHLPLVWLEAGLALGSLGMGLVYSILALVSSNREIRFEKLRRQAFDEELERRGSGRHDEQ